MFRSILVSAVLAGSAGMADTPTLVTDIAPVQSLVEAVSGQRPAALVPTGADPHHFQFRPSQAKQVAAADLLFWTGPGLIEWLGDAARDINADITVVQLAGADANHPWLNPEIAIDWTKEMARVLSEHQPESSAFFAANAAQSVDEINAAIKESRAALEPVADLRIVTGHDAFAGFADFFGLEIVATISDAHNHGPGAGHLSEIDHLMEEGGAECILVDIAESSDHAEPLAHAHDMPLVEVDPLGASLPAGPGMYPELIKALARAIATCADDPHHHH